MTSSFAKSKQTNIRKKRTKVGAHFRTLFSDIFFI